MGSSFKLLLRAGQYVSAYHLGCRGLIFAVAPYFDLGAQRKDGTLTEDQVWSGMEAGYRSVLASQIGPNMQIANQYGLRKYCSF